MFGHFGFSYVGFLFLIMLTVPNLIWTKKQPKGYSAENENKNDKKKNAVINKIYEEMQYAKEFIRNWNLSLTEEYSEIYSIDLYHLYKEDKLEEKNLKNKTKK